MLAAEKIHTRVGLCSSCNNASECVFRKKRGFDAIYCETFDNLNGDAKRVPTVLKEIDLPGIEKAAKVTHLGLCANCENRDLCKLPKPDSGVWHCEEYC